ncbi:J domain-containing protein [Capnocytophaga sp. H2931]|uniref:J domain-containing protein n=1 Tax=Capnocytophaga sp. H2931 TaxID=1945657 RepID=UPI000BB1DDE0|nr:DnaJ domain-containing protein [Capnocytophaga sp. H2931]ATA75158.1 hypothetical protein CGC52_06855 [Capnocytophaga sp. H2931]
MFKDYYAILEISIGASDSEIKTAYYNQCKKWHPDRNPNRDTTQQMQDINEAYLILKDKEARQKYDAEYIRFREYQQKTQQKYNTHRQENAEQSQTTYSEYRFADDILEKWMQNAKNQAKKMAQDITDELRGSFKEAGKSVAENILPAIIGYVFGPIIIFLIFSIVKSCN